jgi:hypothetical protein
MSILNNLDKWLLETGIKKTAEEASTSHPSGSEDDGTQPAPEGARSSENSKDVSDQSPGQSIEDAENNSEKGPGGENTPALHQGVEAKATGEDPANETSSAKDKKDDPGTSHPAEAGTEKYGSLEEFADSILADIAVATASVKTAEENEDKSGDESKDDKDESKNDKDESKNESQEELSEKDAALKEAGRQAAKDVIEALDSQSIEQVKQAAVINTVKKASADAANVIEYITGFAKAAQGDIDPAMLEQLAMQDPAIAEAIAAEAAAAAGAPVEEAGAPVEEAGAPVESADAEEEAEAEVSEDEINELVEALAASGVSPEDLAEEPVPGEEKTAALKSAVKSILQKKLANKSSKKK